MSRKLPATTTVKSSVPAGMHFAVLAWILFFVCLAYMFSAGVSAVLMGDPFGSMYHFGFGLALLWSTAGFMINVPLCVYLTTKFGKGEISVLAVNYKRSIRMWERLPVIKDVNFGVGLATLAFIEHTRGHFDDAENYYRKALRVIEKNKRAAYPHLAAVANNYAGLLIRQSRFEEADFLLQTSLSIWEAQKGSEWNGSAIPLCTMAAVQLEQGELDKAEDYLLQARRRFEESDPNMILPDCMWQCRVACFLLLTWLYCQKQLWTDAFKFMDMTLELVHQKPISFGTLALYTANKIVEELLNAEKYEQAEQMLELAYYTAGKVPDHPDTITLLEHYDILLQLTDRAGEIPDMRRWIRPVLHPTQKLISAKSE
jgi:tetratricopeptide (TPR) repeat protein